MLSKSQQLANVLVQQLARRTATIISARFEYTAAEIEKDLPPPPASPFPQADPEKCPVNSYNEWDPLEEVIVGIAEGAVVPHVRPEIRAAIRPTFWPWVRENAGKPFAPESLAQAKKEVDEFHRVLELEGCVVRRPEVIDWCALGELKTPDFSEPGFHTACPRDGLVVFGNEIVEAPMSWRSRYYDTRPYKNLLNEYFKAGAKWTLAPKPTMTDHLYDEDYPFEDLEKRTELAKIGKYELTEAEPAFDAADIIRCGKDVFIQISTATNWSGYEWLKRHLAPNIRVHALNMVDPGPLHVDATFVPLRPGLILANPARPCMQVDFFRKNGWEIIYAPKPTATDDNMLYASQWLSINVLSLDEKRVVVYDKEVEMKKLFEKYGFQPIGVDMTTAFSLGGAFHCWTLDVRRKGELKSYFDKV